MGRDQRSAMATAPDHRRTGGGPDSTVLRKLESDHNGSGNPGNGSGSAAGFCEPTATRGSQEDGAQFQLQRNGNAGSRDRGAETEGSHRTGEVPGSGLLWPSVLETKEGWNHEACIQSEAVEQIFEVPALENGEYGNGHHVDSEKGLVLQDRSQGCVSSGPSVQGTQEVPVVHVEGTGMAIPSPSIWAGVGAQVLHQVAETSNGIAPEGRNETDFFPGRFTDHEPELGNELSGQGLSAVSVAETRFYHQLEEVGATAQSGHGIPGILDEFFGYDHIIAADQDLGYPVSLPGYESLFFGLSETVSKVDWQADSNSAGGHPRAVVLQTTSDAEHQGSAEKPTRLPGDCQTGPGMQGRTGMVGGITGDLQWLVIHLPESGYDNNVRCIEERLGSNNLGQQHPGSVVARGDQISHQSVGAASSRASTQSIYQRQETDPCSLAAGQQDSGRLPEQTGRNEVTTVASGDKGGFGVLSGTRDHDYCGVPAGSSEWRGGLREPCLSGQQQLAAGHNSICTDSITMGNHEDGSV